MTQVTQISVYHFLKDEQFIKGNDTMLPEEFAPYIDLIMNRITLPILVFVEDRYGVKTCVKGQNIINAIASFARSPLYQSFAPLLQNRFYDTILFTMALPVSSPDAVIRQVQNIQAL